MRGNAASSSRLCSNVLPNPKPEAGVDHEVVHRDAGVQARAAAGEQEAPHLRYDVVVGGRHLHGGGYALHVHQANRDVQSRRGFQRTGQSHGHR